MSVGVRRIQQECNREGGHFHPGEPGTQGSTEEVMLELNSGLHWGFPGRLERASPTRHLCVSLRYWSQGLRVEDQWAVSLEIRKDFVGCGRAVCVCPRESLEFELYPLGSREPRKDLE